MEGMEAFASRRYETDAIGLSYSMVLLWPEYFHLNINLLVATGLWPYINTALVKIQRAAFIAILLCGASVQVAGLLKARHSLKLVLKNLAYCCVSFSFIVKYFSHIILLDSAVQVLSEVLANLRNIRQKEEREIMAKYARNGKYHTKVFALLVVPPVFGIAIWPFHAILLDFVVPLNETRARQLPLIYGAVSQQEKYVSVTVLFISLTYLAGGLTLLATETISIQCLQHACGLWEITSYRIKKACEMSRQKTSNSNDDAVKTFVSGLEMHVHTLTFCNHLKTNFAPPYLFLLVVGISSVSIHLFRFSQLLVGLEEAREGVSSLLFAIAIFVYLFYLNYMCQDVIDKSIMLSTESFAAPWYEAPLPLQKFLVIVLLRSFRSFSFDLFGMFHPSHEGFAVITKNTLSYFMVLQSVQHRNAQS